MPTTTTSMSSTIQPGAIVTGERVDAGPPEVGRMVTGPLLPPHEFDPPEIARIRIPTEDDPSSGAEAKIAVHRHTLQPTHPKGGSPR
jgi:hypothetical protein